MEPTPNAGSIAKERIVPSNEQGADMTVIGRETTIRGEIDFEHSARILGTLEGKIRSRGEVQIGESAQCKADVDAARVVIEGAIEGNITAREALRLEKTAHLTGDILATALHVEEGASFIGHCRVGDAATADSSPGATQPPASSPPPPPASGPQVDFKPPWRTSSSQTEEQTSGVTGRPESGAA
jgi:cytoskeletal protein CcmA (bactofilin family)